MSEETDALFSANETLEEEVQRLRKTVTMLRRINGVLRRASESLRRQADLAQRNDEVFKHICESGFGATGMPDEGGLPEDGIVEPVTIGAEEASNTTASS